MCGTVTGVLSAIEGAYYAGSGNRLARIHVPTSGHHPADRAHTEACATIDANPPQTVARLIAKAQASAAEDGPGRYGERWLEEIGRDLLRPAGAGVTGGEA